MTLRMSPGALYFDNACHDPSAWGLQVYNWTAHGLYFPSTATNHRARSRTDGKPDIPFGVLHWTGGEGNYRQVAQVLERRRLGVHFFVDYHGHCFQYADPGTTVCPHAGRANGFSWGVEIQNRGTIRGELPARGMQEQEIHQHAYQVAEFSPAQVTTVVSLCEAMAALCGHPRHVPDRLGVLDDWERFSGVLGHLHVSPKKTDPGGQMFEALVDTGWRRTA